MNLELILTKENIVEEINKNIDYLLNVIPEIKSMIGFDHKHPHHHLDVWNHTLMALNISENDFETRLILLLHDIGKPFSYQEGEIRHFKGHPLVSAKMAYEILNRLKYSNDFIKRVCYIIEKHDELITDDDIENNYDITRKRYKVQYCDSLAHSPDKLKKRIEYLEHIENRIKIKKI